MRSSRVSHFSFVYLFFTFLFDLVLSLFHFVRFSFYFFTFFLHVTTSHLFYLLFTLNFTFCENQSFSRSPKEGPLRSVTCSLFCCSPKARLYNNSLNRLPGFVNAVNRAHFHTRDSFGEEAGGVKNSHMGGLVHPLKWFRRSRSLASLRLLCFLLDSRINWLLYVPVGNKETPN